MTCTCIDHPRIRDKDCPVHSVQVLYDAAVAAATEVTDAERALAEALRREREGGSVTEALDAQLAVHFARQRATQAQIAYHRADSAQISDKDAADIGDAVRRGGE